jgi:hypothetical protein
VRLQTQPRTMSFTPSKKRVKDAHQRARREEESGLKNRMSLASSDLGRKLHLLEQQEAMVVRKELARKELARREMVVERAKITAGAAEMRLELDALGSDLRGLGGQMEAVELALASRVVQLRHLILAARARLERGSGAHESAAHTGAGKYSGGPGESAQRKRSEGDDSRAVSEKGCAKVEASAWSKGKQLFGKYRDGHWYACVLVHARGDGNFLVSWDDGDEDDRIKSADDLRPRQSRRPRSSEGSDEDQHPTLRGGAIRNTKKCLRQNAERRRLLADSLRQKSW